jgi:hypothetical protein
MANNRLFIVNQNTNEYVCIAKADETWHLGNVDILKNFLENINGLVNPNLVIGSENDAEFYDKYLKNGTNINDANKWHYL